MQTLDPFQPLFSVSDVSACTSVDKFTPQNYIAAGHVIPSKIGNRRAFSAEQMVEIEIIGALSKVYQIPPSQGKVLARRAMELMTREALADDAVNMRSQPAWATDPLENVEIQMDMG